MPEPDVERLVEDARAGRARAVGRLLSLVEEESPALRRAITLIAPHTGRAHVVGITGAPGVGKSTSTSAVVTDLRRRGRRVAVLAVDPSSPFSGGALLGDRVRMGDHATDAGVFIRSMASRGHLGGLSWATPQAVRVLDVAGFDVVIVAETVGVGQSEVEVAGAADTTVVLLAPGMGDGIQAAKAGILEVGDVYVVNKSDREGAAQVRRDVRSMLALSHGSHGSHESRRTPSAPGARPSSPRPPPAARGSPRSSTPSRSTSPGRGPAVPWTAADGDGPATRSSRSRWPRCGVAGPGSPTAAGSRSWPGRSSPATSTPTPRRTPS